jgi:mRNA-degrading endonuclease toxin of MazEF toxin-antitoxin module
VVVSLPEEIQPLPYRVLIVVPLTRTRFTGPLFPVLTAGTGGLPAESTALVYQVLALDVRRVRGRIGTLTEAEFAPLREGLRQMFDFPEEDTDTGDNEATAKEGPAGEEKGPGEE